MMIRYGSDMTGALSDGESACLCYRGVSLKHGKEENNDR